MNEAGSWHVAAELTQPAVIYLSTNGSVTLMTLNRRNHYSTIQERGERLLREIKVAWLKRPGEIQCRQCGKPQS